MSYFKWFLFLLIGVPFELFAKLLSPVLACFVQDDGWLPKWLWMFQTPDNTCDGDRTVSYTHLTLPTNREV